MTFPSRRPRQFGILFQPARNAGEMKERVTSLTVQLRPPVESHKYAEIGTCLWLIERNEEITVLTLEKRAYFLPLIFHSVRSLLSQSVHSQAFWQRTVNLTSREDSRHD